VLSSHFAYFCTFLPWVLKSSQTKMLAGDIMSETQLWSKTSKIWAKTSNAQKYENFCSSIWTLAIYGSHMMALQGLLRCWSHFSHDFYAYIWFLLCTDLYISHPFLETCNFPVHSSCRARTWHSECQETTCVGAKFMVFLVVQGHCLPTCQFWTKIGFLTLFALWL
jgi:hypothetical protein